MGEDWGCVCLRPPPPSLPCLSAQPVLSWFLSSPGPGLSSGQSCAPCLVLQGAACPRALSNSKQKITGCHRRVFYKPLKRHLFSPRQGAGWGKLGQASMGVFFVPGRTDILDHARPWGALPKACLEGGPQLVPIALAPEKPFPNRNRLLQGSIEGGKAVPAQEATKYKSLPPDPGGEPPRGSPPLLPTEHRAFRGASPAALLLPSPCREQSRLNFLLVMG